LLCPVIGREGCESSSLLHSTASGHPFIHNQMLPGSPQGPPPPKPPFISCVPQKLSTNPHQSRPAPHPLLFRRRTTNKCPLPKLAVCHSAQPPTASCCKASPSTSSHIFELVVLIGNLLRKGQTAQPPAPSWPH
jgi:hypothetical protein